MTTKKCLCCKKPIKLFMAGQKYCQSCSLERQKLKYEINKLKARLTILERDRPNQIQIKKLCKIFYEKTNFHSDPNEFKEMFEREWNEIKRKV